VDLSGLIFVVLAVGWAAYLIPRALRHHEEIAASRPVDNFSETMRVLERTPATMKALLTPPAATEAAPSSRVRRTRRPSTPARRRRRVLGLLLLLTTASGVAAYLAYLPAWSPAIPGALVVAWLVLCRLMVRKGAPVRRSVAPTSMADEGLRVARAEATDSPVAEPALAPTSPVAAPTSPVVAPTSPVVEPVETDDGSLWDPLPLTLPTYVSKPAARRTVRTIDLTQTGVTSSGHRPEDTELARKAEADAKAQADTEAAEQRKVAGA
jgi:hypothetical protein